MIGRYRLTWVRIPAAPFTFISKNSKLKMMKRVTSVISFLLGDGNNLFLVDKNGSIYDQGYYLSEKPRMEFLHLGLVSNKKIIWLDENFLISQEWKVNEIESKFRINKKEIKINDKLINGVLIREINLSSLSKLCVVTKLFSGEWNNETGTLVKNKFIISFGDWEKEKNVLYSPQLEKVFTFFKFYRKIGYPTHLQPSSQESKSLTNKFFKKILKEKGSKEFLTSHCILILKGKDIKIFHTSGKDLKTIFKKIERVEKIKRIYSKNRKKVGDKEIIKMLISKKTGMPIAAPEYEDPFNPYVSSGGYAYCWFRDALKKLQNFPDFFEKFLETFLRKKYEIVPHRVWAFDGSLAPGWANGHLTYTPWNYQSDQLATFVTVLANYLNIYQQIEEKKIKLFIKLLERLLERSYKNGIPLICQNCWEDHIGIFSSTTGNYLQAFLSSEKVLEELGFSKLYSKIKKRRKRLLNDLKIFWKNGAFRFYLNFPKEIYCNVSTLQELSKIDYKKGKLIKELDSATFELIKGLINYDINKFAEKILSHLEKAAPSLMLREKPFKFLGLWKKTNKIEGLIRYQKDVWRRNPGKYPEKVWSVSTLEGAETFLLASKKFFELGDKDLAKDLFKRGYYLFSLFSKQPLLAEQYYDDGTPDSAIPLGWSHAQRFRIKKMLKFFKKRSFKY